LMHHKIGAAKSFSVNLDSLPTKMVRAAVEAPMRVSPTLA